MPPSVTHCSARVVPGGGHARGRAGQWTLVSMVRYGAYGMTAGPIPLDFPALRAAAAGLQPAVLHTALLRNDALSAHLGASVHLKLENLQRTGSFKIRGATHKINRLLAAGGEVPGVIAVSAG